MKSSKTRTIVKIILMAIVVSGAVAIALNRVYIVDFFRGLNYQPSSEMASIREKLDLTDYGKLLFNASRPQLNNEDDFNTNCQSINDEDAILGCYADFGIYVYNITEPRLVGIRELTTAHELLHAMYARIDDSERDALRSDLEKVFADNQSILKEEIDAYDSEEQLEEIYVRAGTEIKELPDSLEKHFAKVFNEQDKIVDFYNGYISVFRQLEQELDKLKNEMNDLDAQIETKTIEYERRSNQLNSEIDTFNNCASTAGCFTSQYAFNLRRNQLLSEQGAVNALYDELDGLIDRYNSLVEQYNNNVIENNNLQNIINSHVKMEEL